MTVKCKSSATVAERPAPARKPVVRPQSRETAPRLGTGEMLKEIQLRGERLSTEIEELLVRLR